MAKLKMCRICLLENVHMYVVTNKSLQETYAKLTDAPFVTEDSRPMLACSFCYTKLKHCCQLQRKCLEAEELFTQMLNNCEPEPLTHQGHLECSSGFIKTAIEIISIVDGQSEADAIEIDLPAASERQHDVLEIKVERHSHDFESENNYAEENSSLYVENSPPHHPSSDSEDDVPLVEIKTEVETVEEEIEDLSEKQYRGKHTKNMAPEHQETSLPEVIHIPPYRPRSHSEDNIPMMEVRAEVDELIEKGQELSEKKPTAKKTKRAPVTKKSKLKDVTSTDKKRKNGRSTLKSNRTTQIRTSASHTKAKDPIFNTKLSQTSTDSVFNLSDLINNAIDTNFCSKSAGGKIINSQIKSDDIKTENSFKCDVCDREFKDKGNLRRHVLGHGEAPFECYLCRRGFHAKSHLAKHHRTHTGERPFECDQCHRCFSEKSNLIKHVRRHNGDKPYKCDVCQRSFNQKYHLQSHSLVHTGEKPFKCDLCHQGFNRLYNFKQHYRTHTGEKPHECLLCDKSFTHKTSLTNHMRKHTGEKPFKCFLCQRSFTHKQSLDMHLRTHTGEKPYKCDVCQKCFTQGSHLKQHLARNHIGDKP